MTYGTTGTLPDLSNLNEDETMTPQEIQIAVAEEMGWTLKQLNN